MNDMVAVAVVHALKDLLHQNGSVLLCELPTGNDFVKQLSSLADSRIWLVK
jgi:hypothetical protein